MTQYETGFIVSPALPEEEAGRLIQQMAEVVAQKKGRMVKQDVWGKRRLAYGIKRFHEGVYVFFTYEGGGDVPLELERRFKQTDAVIRFLTVKKDARDLLPRRKKKTPPEAPPAPAAEPAASAPEEK
jgi:small subunit ribosomal protein S6